MAEAAAWSRIGAIRDILPKGQTLPEELWGVRHRGVVVLLWVHAAVIPVYALLNGYSLLHSIAETSVVPLTAAVALWPGLNRRARTAVASLGLLTCSAVLVHLSGGLIEMHFHFFVMVAVVALYQDWIPFLAAVGYVFVHHGLIGAIAPESVFAHLAGRTDPWVWAGIHAFFILGISAACLVTWRLNESILDERRGAEDRLREESRIVETLHQVGNMLAADLDSQRVIQAVTDAATELTGAAFGAFFYNVVDDAGESYTLYTLSGAPASAFERFGLPRNTPVFGPTFAGEGVVRLDDVTADPRYGQMAPHYGMPKGHLPVRSYLAVPVRSRGGDVLGGLFFGHPDTAQFTRVHERIVVGIAAQAAMAMDNARLYDAERHARTVSDAARVRVSLLAEAGRILTSSLEVDELLSQLSRLLAPTVADYCAIELLDDETGARALTVASTAGRVWAEPADPALHQPQPHPGAVARAVRSRQAELVTGEAGACLAAIVPGPEFAAVLARDGAGTAVVVPLLAHDAVFGVLVLATRDATDRAFTGEDVPFVEELARRAATAVENARLFSRQRTVAETLQHSLLPERLPELPGLDAAARYLPGGPDVEVGGDWYDMIPLPEGMLALAMGDVVGRGEKAAALMGQLRSSVRAYAMDGKSPVDVMEGLNAILLDAGPEHMATMVYGVLDTEAGVFRYVNAGHPPPLAAMPDGTAHYLDHTPGLPIGASPSPRYVQCEAPMPGGATVVLYTDGLVEDRTTPLELGLSRLRDAVLSGPEHLDQLCAHVVGTAMADRIHSDDIAILAVRVLPVGSSLHLRVPAQPQMLSPLRALLRRWLTAAGATEQERYEVLLATVELCTNAIRHPGGAPSGHFQLDATTTDAVRITVRDQGHWREPGGTVGGRGLAIAEACADQLEVVRGETGTEVRLTRRLAAHTAAEAVG